MSDEDCDCCETTVAQSIKHTTTGDRWLTERPVATASLPPETARIWGQFYGNESIETLDDFVAATRTGAGGGSIAIEDLCHDSGKTPHYATTEDDTYHFLCFYDGVALAHLVDEPVDIRTESPSGTSIEIRASPAGTVDVTPSETAMSFGIATELADLSNGGPTPEDVYEATCPYIKTFPSRESYESWAAGVNAATVGMPLAAGMPIAAALTEEA